MSDDLRAGLNPNPDQPIAIIVFHGIGQQAPFETLNTVVEGFIQAHRDAGRGWKVDEVRLPEEDTGREQGEVDFISLDDRPNEMLPLADIKLKNREGVRQDLHFFEVYWAPLTESVVSFLEVLLFLLKASWDGFWSQIRQREFSRFTFGKEQKYGILALTALQLLFAGLMVLGLVILSGAFFGSLLLDVLSHFRFAAAAHFPVEQIRSELVSFAFSLPLLMAPPILNALVQRSLGATTSTLGSVLNFIVVIPVLAGIAGFGFSVLYSLATLQPGWTWWSDSWVQGIPSWARWLVFTSVGSYMYYKFYLFVVKFVGDVTAYVSAHAVNRFWKIRDQIQYRALGICRSVYMRGGPDDPYYKNIVLIGHSLGSVIAYDILNTLINLETHHCTQNLKDTAARTRLLLTCGSPLNKIAFLFRFQTGTGSMPRWRELLNNFRQPLIVAHDRVHRPARWINISCFPDWISGQLRYYEPPAKTGQRPTRAEAFTHQIIDECRDADGILPLIAHNQYFDHREFRNAVYDALWTRFL